MTLCKSCAHFNGKCALNPKRDTGSVSHCSDRKSK